jgi:hypothetical protein
VTEPIEARKRLIGRGRRQHHVFVVRDELLGATVGGSAAEHDEIDE